MLRFLTALRASRPGTPLYFGSNTIASARWFCTRSPRCLLRSAAWRGLEAAVGAAGATRAALGAAGANRTGQACPWSRPWSYAQGGAFGFDAAALSALVRGGCMAAVATAAASFTAAGSPARRTGLYEDEAVGLCMLLRRVRLVTCDCFYAWGPDANASRRCRLPLTVHKLRRLAWFDDWWARLSPLEPAALAQLDALEHAAARTARGK